MKKGHSLKFYLNSLKKSSFDKFLREYDQILFDRKRCTCGSRRFKDEEICHSQRVRFCKVCGKCLGHSVNNVWFKL